MSNLTFNPFAGLALTDEGIVLAEVVRKPPTLAQERDAVVAMNRVGRFLKVNEHSLD
jgi:hypothetical protein